MTDIQYSIEPGLSREEFVDVLRRSTLAERRPIDDAERMEAMLRHADIIVAARNSDGLLVGISRSLSDFAFCCYLADLAVDAEFQGRGIGKELIRRTHEIAGHRCRLILLAAPAAKTYYPHIGLAHAPDCWTINRTE